MTVLLLALRQR